MNILFQVEKRKMKKGKKLEFQNEIPNVGNKRNRETPGSSGIIHRPPKKQDVKNTPTYAETLSKANLIIAIVDLDSENQNLNDRR